jgi:hypothetical protein
MVGLAIREDCKQENASFIGTTKLFSSIVFGVVGHWSLISFTNVGCSTLDKPPSKSSFG